MRDRFRPVLTDGVVARPGAGPEALVPAAPEDEGVEPTVATAQPLVCPDRAKPVETIMVAARAGEILDIPNLIPTPGMPYDRRTSLYDPDGLMIVSLPLEELAKAVPPDPSTGRPREVLTFFDVVDAGAVPKREDILAMLKRRYKGVERPSPYVLRVNAGDCVSVAMIKAMRPRDENPHHGVRNIPGDALLPKIVPLNTDPLQLGETGRGVWSSSRVAFTLPAALTSPRNGVPFPFGVNQMPPLLTETEAKTLDPADCGLGSGNCLPGRSWTTMTFYAGSLSVDARALGALFPWTFPPGHPVLSGLEVKNRPSGGCRSGEVEFAFLTVLLCAASGPIPLDFSSDAVGEPESNANQVADKLAAHLRPHQKSFLSAIPYAAGALPIRVAGDLIGHAAHGLSGMLIVEPKEARYPSRPENDGLIRVVSKTHDTIGEPVQAQAIKLCPLDAKDHDDETCPARIPEARINEHALVVQDGLNLWSRRFAASGGNPVPVDYQGYRGHPMPNCLVCDDSYDLGEKGVSYRSAPFTRRLGGAYGIRDYPDDGTNLNAAVFPKNFFSAVFAPVPTPTLQAKAGEETMIRVAHPAGRSRHRAFVTLGASYDDLLPGFGAGHSGHLAPGKAFTASFCASRQPGTYLYRDGPQVIFAAGSWGHGQVTKAPPGAPLCAP